MKDRLKQREYYPSREEALEWKAPWDHIKYDTKRKEYYLEYDKQSNISYSENLERLLSIVMKNIEKRRNNK